MVVVGPFTHWLERICADCGRREFILKHGGFRCLRGVLRRVAPPLLKARSRKNGEMHPRGGTSGGGGRIQTTAPNHPGRYLPGLVPEPAPPPARRPPLRPVPRP